MGIATENRSLIEKFNQPLLDREKLKSSTGKLIMLAVGLILLELIIRFFHIVV